MKYFTQYRDGELNRQSIASEIWLVREEVEWCRKSELWSGFPCELVALQSLELLFWEVVQDFSSAYKSEA
jgi:hypothetical protein